MNLLIKQLTTDHRHFTSILYHLEKEIKAYSGLIKCKPNLEKILDILDYIRVYPTIWHHPVEDIIYEVLLEKDIDNPSAVADLMEEHGVLDVLTGSLHQSFDSISQGRSVSTARLIKRTSEFIQHQLQHINQEQSIFYPLVERYLSAEDWEDISRRLNEKVNIEHDMKSQEYTLLYKNIVNSSALTAV